MKKRAIQYALFFLLVGVLLTVLIGYVERKTIKSYEDNLPYISLGENIKNRTMQARLNLEQIKGGEASLNYNNDVLPGLTSSLSLLNAAYSGKSNDEGNFVKSNEETRALIKETILNLEKLIGAVDVEKTIVPAAVMTDSTGAIISSPRDDRQLNTAFQQVQTALDRLIVQVNQDVNSDRTSLNIYSWVSILLLSIVFLCLGFVLYKMQEKSDRVVGENSKRLDEQEKSVQAISGFIESISAGDFAVDLKMEGDANLSSTLLNMRDKLRENSENDRKRNWSTSGLAQIGEILRSNTSTTSELYDNILRFVVKYTKSNQGGLFLLNEDSEKDHFLELVACYAFERKKYLTKKVVIGEGLVGQCVLEGERIYLLEVPQEYISITSGLGGSNPNALLIVPLKVNEKIFGALELATFTKYEDFEIELVEKLAETIASTISTVRINDSTRLLLEKTQQQAEEMRAQEEEMRQNMEELEATQEEMRRKEKHIQEMLEGEKLRSDFNNKSRQIVINLSKSSNILQGNWAGSLEAITKAVGQQLKVSRVAIWRYDRDTNVLVNEKTFILDRKTYEQGKTLSGEQFPLMISAVDAEKTVKAKDIQAEPETREMAEAYFHPLKINSWISVPYFSEGRVEGVISCEQQFNSYDWTDDHVEFLKSSADLLTVTINTVRINAMLKDLGDAQETLQTIIDNLPRAVFWKDRDLRIQGCNRIFANVAGLKSHKELIGKSDYDMPWREHADAYRADDLSVMNSKQSRIDQEERNVNSEGVESWVLTSKVPVMNHEGEVVAVLGMFEDITDRKRREADVSAKLKELDELKKRLGGK